MSEQGVGNVPARHEQIRIKMSRLRQSRQRSVLGVPEIIGLAVSVLLLLLVLFAYFYSLSPARSRLETLNIERSNLQRKLRNSQEGLTQITDTQTAVLNINKSLEDFENNRLPNRNAGRLDLYTELNQLIRRNGLRNTAGPNYVALDALDIRQKPGAARQQKTGNAKWQSIFPGIGVTLTVEGPYANQRRFIRDIELSKQFVVINAVELESVKDTEAPATAMPTIAPGTGLGAIASRTPSGPATRGMLVSLRMDLATYFRRDASETLPASATETH